MSDTTTTPDQHSPDVQRALEEVIDSLSAELGDTEDSIDLLAEFAEANQMAVGSENPASQFNRAMRVGFRLAMKLSGGLRGAHNVAEAAVDYAKKRSFDEALLQAIVQVAPVIAASLVAKPAAGLGESFVEPAPMGDGCFRPHADSASLDFAIRVREKMTAGLSPEAAVAAVARELGLDVVDQTGEVGESPASPSTGGKV